MATQISPESYYRNLVEEETPPIQPVTTVRRQALALDTTPTTSDSSVDHILIFGMVAVVGMVALCFIAYQRDKRVKDEPNTVFSNV